MLRRIQAGDVSFPRIYSLHSQKGGVGKTSIALAIAGLASHVHRRRTLIIDADLTGVSLCDIPRIMSEKSSNRQYFNNLLLAPPGEFEKSIDTIRKKPKREVLEQFQKKYCWLSESSSNISILPSSPRLKDVNLVLPLITQEDHLSFFRHRLEDILAFILSSGYEVVIVDFSPGLFGISKSAFFLALDLAISHYLKIEDIWARLERLYRPKENSEFPVFQAVMCTTEDHPDYLALLGSLSDIFEEQNKKNRRNELEINIYDAMAGRLWLAFNKVHENPYDIIPPILKDLMKQNVSFKRSIDRDLMQFFDTQMQDRGASGGLFVEKHRIQEILLAAEHFSNNLSNTDSQALETKEAFAGKYEDWLRFVGLSSGLLSEN